MITRIVSTTRFAQTLVLVALSILTTGALGQSTPDYGISLGKTGPLIEGIPTTVTITLLGEQPESLDQNSIVITGVFNSSGNEVKDAQLRQDGQVVLENVFVPGGRVAVLALDGTELASGERLVLPGVVTLLPPFIAILLALITRQVLIALFAGVWVGAALVHGLNPISSLLRAADTYIVTALADTDHAFILMFSLSLAGMIGIVTGAGGMKGIVQAVSRYARTPRSGQTSTWVLGLLIFFDDYANTLIVGNTMRPFTDRIRISREKLAFIVDATAAPVATIGIISTWTAYQIGIIEELMPGITEVAGWKTNTNAYLFFLSSIPYSFYSFGMLFLVFMIAITNRDFGPMLSAENRARATGKVLRDGAEPLTDTAIDQMGENPELTPRWYVAAIPIGCVIALTLWGLVHTGMNSLRDSGVESPALRDVFGNADAYRSLLWAALGASLVAAILARVHGQKVQMIVTNWVTGAKSLALAAMILLLAWSIGAVCKDIHTGNYVASLTEGVLSPRLVPALAFVSAGIIAFSTGTSYGTMGILIPILLPLSVTLAVNGGLPDLAQQIGLSTLAAILGGSVFGDHCSPISDTTVLSSMASGSDHVDHVRTQLPYALMVGAICLPMFLATGWNVSPLFVIPLTLILVAGLFFGLSRRISD